jgi:hypothetical protein
MGGRTLALRPSEYLARGIVAPIDTLSSLW